MNSENLTSINLSDFSNFIFKMFYFYYLNWKTCNVPRAVEEPWKKIIKELIKYHFKFKFLFVDFL